MSVKQKSVFDYGFDMETMADGTPIKKDPPDMILKFIDVPKKLYKPKEISKLMNLLTIGKNK